MSSKTLHLCNTFFEWELAEEVSHSLENAFCKNEIFEQLQFLPLLYAQKGDGIVTTFKPEEKSEFPFFHFQDAPPLTHLETWGYSQLAQDWAKQRGIQYEIPNWEIVKKVNSKVYSFLKSPLPGGSLLFDEPIPKGMLLKSCYGTAGRGHIFSDHPKAKDFCKREWQKNRPVISEPWVERKLDFSTQWKIHKNKHIEYLGPTICKTTERGAHVSNIVGIANIPFLEEHKAFVTPVLGEMAELGYFGEVGVDAMVYGNDQLQPIVEINARKTMGWLTLMVQKNRYPGKEVELSYIVTNERGPLPTHSKNRKFPRQVIVI